MEIFLKKVTSEEKDTSSLLAKVAYWDHKPRRDYHQPLPVRQKLYLDLHQHVTTKNAAILLATKACSYSIPKF